MKITLNDKEKAIIKKYHKIRLNLLLIEDYFGHYYIELDKGDLCVKAKKRGLRFR